MASPAKETYESLNIEPKPLRPHILAAATVVFGEDYYAGRRETISLSGFVQLNKWPMAGFGHSVDDRGRAEFDLELISAPEVGIKGYSYMLEDRLQVLSNPYLPNTGHVRQVVPGKNFPAEFYIRRFGILETSTLRLAHRDVIDIRGIIDHIPPFKQPLTPPYLGRPRSDGPGEVIPALNVVSGQNLPEAWYPADDLNQATGLVPTVFFAPSMGPCVSMLVDPSIIIQASMEGAITVQASGRTETIELAGLAPARRRSRDPAVRPRQAPRRQRHQGPARPRRDDRPQHRAGRPRHAPGQLLRRIRRHPGRGHRRKPQPGPLPRRPPPRRPARDPHPGRRPLRRQPGTPARPAQGHRAQRHPAIRRPPRHRPAHHRRHPRSPAHRRRTRHRRRPGRNPGRSQHLTPAPTPNPLTPAGHPGRNHTRPGTPAHTPPLLSGS